MLNKYTDILDSNLQYNSAEQEQFKYSNIFRLENISCFLPPVFLSNWMYYDVGDSELKVTIHTYQKTEEEIRKKTSNEHDVFKFSLFPEWNSWLSWRGTHQTKTSIAYRPNITKRGFFRNFKIKDKYNVI